MVPPAAWENRDSDRSRLPHFLKEGTGSSGGEGMSGGIGQGIGRGIGGARR